MNVLVASDVCVQRAQSRQLRERRGMEGVCSYELAVLCPARR